MRHILCLSGLLALAACQGGNQPTNATQSAPVEVAAQDDAPNPTESPIDPDPANPLVGDWRLDNGLACNYNHATFTQDMRVLHLVGDADHPGTDVPVPVDKYTVNGPKITLSLIGDDKPASYVMFDPTHMGDGTPNCRFHKDPVSVSATPTPTP